MSQEKILTRDEVKKLGLDNVSTITADMLEGYTSIGNFAFNYCFSLISVDIPDNVTRIGSLAFYKCTGLTSIIIPNSITSIGSCAFACCNSLISVKMPNNITNIGNNVFSYCTSLTSMKIPDSITIIGGGIFNGCNCLTSVVIGNTEYKKHEIINSKCKAYKGFMANMTCRNFQYEEGKTYELDDEPKLCKCGFHACLSLADVFTYYYGRIGKDIVVCEVELEGVSDEEHNDSKVVAKKITICKRIL